ncbi:aminotransferase class I/II-fold pyridoxal phosphate-dependent enzyme [Aetokthonos hydrillicola Thurmond2011]|uniref:Aminotransferase class I/II-fold pyridoxal phosphate-dependent enzyme n=1 Tax=Aetokthonos hydrillicola Thurmond2011 TaxID=2712845 RepID=A0AAP5I6P1_9CYAN|nr:aminotransferase class I/II-fold pyridoxal phosphate-dependent enzyme [Aetokthonos hydrillicola]MBO3463344.1 aminotransferase class I/II-fold pyridoxal phosphate-dependent enzyme [Aetokthonos hydrillicola CCALA 1050]MBW4589557.1 aminotransferase class I/II-fold pyridoxal phosphate-dependent enzyme [Aetokthonos hydrillicola CCALA 1050]MDR9896018.1 aminotransferase class I/II-fold pyridoxal phosphate-dependent enzyme [Aetokthonos hydrillicola Thurmond2011]
MQIVKEYVQRWYESGLDPDEYVCHNKQGNIVEIEDAATGDRRTVLTFCTNDVLGLVQEEAVKQAAIDAILKYGTSNSSTSVLSGRIDLHRQLEDEISAFKHLPHTQLFMNAWMAMQALMDAFCHLAIPVPGFQNTRETLILTDVLNHGCIVSAVVNAGTRSGKVFGHSPRVRVKAYRHCNMEDLARKLRRYALPDDRIMVISDAVFSMDGDIAPLPEMLDILENYPGSVLVMDEAHASGSIGKTGRGIYEHFNLLPMQAVQRGVVPLIMTTFSKFAASAGAAISSHVAELVPLLNVSPTSIGTISLPPPMTAAALESIRQVRKAPELVQKLQENTRYLRSRLAEHDFVAIGETNVIPVILPSELNPKLFARELLQTHGIWVSPIWFIAKPRVRITVNALHTQADMDRLVSTMVATRNLLYKPTISA